MWAALWVSGGAQLLESSPAVSQSPQLAGSWNGVWDLDLSLCFLGWVVVSFVEAQTSVRHLLLII